jgi:hypothetical protein
MVASTRTSGPAEVDHAQQRVHHRDRKQLTSPSRHLIKPDRHETDFLERSTAASTRSPAAELN